MPENPGPDALVETVEKLRATLRERTAELDSLTYAVSHDLRAPIRHLSGFSRILVVDATDLSAQTRHVVERIEQSAAQLREMVDGLLALSRISRTEVERQSVDLAELARTVALQLGHERVDGHVVEFVVPDRLPVSGDPKLLTLLLLQLLDNGWKFSAGVPRPRVELGVQRELGRGADPAYFVRDNGVGFESGGQQRLFGAFQRLHGPGDFPGTGLGLATAARIVAKHGGTIGASGAPDQGATFLFTLPG
jgi:signal transduction histidine kinase